MNTNAQNYFLRKIKDDTDIENCYFFMPSNDCFTYCINEIRVALSNKIEENVNNNYVLELSRWFYLFLEKDTILRKVNSLKYSYLLILMKDLSEGKKTNDKEILTILTDLKNSLSSVYLERVIFEIIGECNNDDPVFDHLREMTNLFINECLARGIDIRFIHKSIEWFTKGHFSSLEDYLHFFSGKAYVKYDIYIPIKNYSDINSDVFEKNDQEIIEQSGIHYLHIYQNDSIDYYTLITHHMIRVDSIFNMLKYYTASQIDYDYSQDILIDINSKHLNEKTQEFIKFNSIVKYQGATPYSKFIINTIENLNFLYNEDKDLYHKILNIIGYSEKGNDLINTSSYVDAWIALESLYSLDEVLSNYVAVKSYLPSFLSSRILLNRITYLLKKCFGSKNRLKAENFFKISEQQITEKLKDLPCDYYYKKELLYLKHMTSDVTNLRKLYEGIEKKMSIDVLRIYMLRNEYVHESKLGAFKSLQFYKLKNYLTLSIDLFFNMLNQRVNIERDRKEYSIGYEVFSKIKEKNRYRDTLFTVCTEKRKYCSNERVLAIDEIGNNIDLPSVITNIVLNNNIIVKKFVKYDEE